MRVLHIMASGAQAGGASHLLGLLPAQRAAGIEATAVVGDDGPLAQLLQEAHVPAQSWALMGSRLDPALGTALWREIDHGRPDIVHAHGTRAAALLGLGRPFGDGRPSPRVLYHAHGLSCSQAAPQSLAWRLRLAGEALACHRKAAVISCSGADLQLLRRQRLLGRCPSFIVPNATAGAGQAPVRLSAAQRRALRHTWDLPPDKLVVATVARLVPQKDVTTLASAVLLLADVSLVVIGSGPQMPALLRHPLMHAGRLRLLGARNDVGVILPACDIFALSSRWEGEPIALLEAMAAGLPWVATHTSGAAQLAALGCGLLSPVGDSAALSRTLGQLTARPGWRRALGRAGARAVAERTVVMQARRIAQIYDDVLAR